MRGDERHHSVGDRPCAVCLARTPPGFRHCHSCEVVRRQLGGDLVPVHPVRLAPRGGEVHRHLVAYKAAPSQFVRAAASERLGGLLAEFLVELLATELAEMHCPGPGVTVLATVPSSGTGRASWHGVHPLAGVVRDACSRVGRSGSPARPTLHVDPALLRRGPGYLGHLLASPDGFLATPHSPCMQRRARILVVDDLYTSGARAQSAARACASAGLTVAAIVPLGRLVDARDLGLVAQARALRGAPRCATHLSTAEMPEARRATSLAVKAC
ncbi:MAG: hypothetical protein ACYCR4_00415 [Acidimicrobiales bacterium]